MHFTPGSVSKGPHAEDHIEGVSAMGSGWPIQFLPLRSSEGVEWLHMFPKITLGAGLGTRAPADPAGGWGPPSCQDRPCGERGSGGDRATRAPICPGNLQD